MYKKFEDLSSEIKLLIFDYLDINSLLKLRLLNKNYRKIIENDIKIMNLCILNTKEVENKMDSYFEDVERFFYTNELLSNSKLFWTGNCNFYRSNFIKVFFATIKKLYFKQSTGTELNIENLIQFLNQLNYLEQLTLFLINRKKTKHLYTLKSNKLRIVHIINKENYDYYSNDQWLKFDTINLYAFRSNKGLNDFKFTYASSLNCISIDDSSKLDDLHSFINLKYIFYDNCNYFRVFGIPDFSNLKYLEELHLNCIYLDSYLKIFLKRKSNKNQFKIYLRGLLVENLIDSKNYFDDHNCLDNLIDSRNFSLHYSQSYKILPTIKKINYNNLLSIFDNSIPSNLHCKLINLIEVQIIKTNKQIDEKQLINFLSKIKLLRILKISASLDQLFYDNLNRYCYLLIVINIEVNEILDLSFLLNLKNLKKCFINQNVSIDMLDKIMNAIDLEIFDFKFKSRNAITVHREEQKNSTIFQFSNLITKFKCKKSLTNFIRNLELIKKLN